MRGGDYPHVHFPRARRPDPLELPFLQHAQELHLDFLRQVADLVEKDRAAVSQLEAPLPHRHGAGERTLLMAEQLAFDQRRRQGGTVDAHQRARMAAAPFVERPGEQLLARSRGPHEQDARVGRSDLPQARQGQPQGATLADDVVEIVIALDFLFQAHVVRFEPGVQPLDLGDAGSQGVLVAATLQGDAEDFRHELHALDHGLRPPARRPAAVDDQGREHPAGHRRWHAEQRTPPWLADRDGLLGKILESRDRP